MKRALPQEVKSVLRHPLEDVDPVKAQPKQNLLGVNRRTRTSAAMIGLALSMGVSSLLLPRQGDGALASEAQPAKSTEGIDSSQKSEGSLENTVLPEVQTQTSLPAVQHIIQEGQTLWQLSREYQVPVDDISRVNGIPSQTPIKPGQVLQIPVSTQPVFYSSSVDPDAQGFVSLTSAASSEEVTTIASGQLSAPQAEIIAEIERIRSRRASSLDRLRQQRDRLKGSLIEQRSSATAEELAVATAVEATSPQPESTSIAEVQQTPSQSSTSTFSVGSQSAIPELGAATLAVPPKNQPSAEVVGTPVAPEPNSAAYQVKPGDTLGEIALNYGVSQADLVRANYLSNPEQLRIDQELLIPLTLSHVSETELTVPSIVPTQPIQPQLNDPETLSEHRVTGGQTVHDIAQQYGVSRASLVEANHLSNPNFILVGQVLRIPSDIVGSAVVQSSDAASLEPSTSSVEPVALPEPFLSPAQAPAIVSIPTVPAAETPLPGIVLSQSVGEVQSAGLGVANMAAIPPTPSTDRPNGWVTTAPVAEQSQNPYVENLLAEILSLRDRYRSEDVTLQPVPQEAVVATIASEGTALLDRNSSSVNPEFNPEAFQQSSPPLVEQSTDAVSPSQAEVETPPQWVATAPLGSENYQPLLQPISGQLVSPDLPPLPGAEAYLPEGSAVFDGYIWPARGVLTSGYGWRWGRRHQGIDIAAPTGTPIYAAATGVVERAGWNSGGYGNMVEIRHPDGSLTRYAHASRIHVQSGQEVDQGVLIADIGSTGYSTGPHLHFEVHLPNQGTVNPVSYLPR